MEPLKKDQQMMKDVFYDAYAIFILIFLISAYVIGTYWNCSDIFSGNLNEY